MKQKQKSQHWTIETAPFLQHCLHYQKTYLLILFLLLSSLIIINNLQEQKPLLSGAESYFHLNAAQEVTWRTVYYYPLSYLEQSFGADLLIFLALIISGVTLFIIWNVFKKLELPPLFTFIFSLFLILTPAFLKSATTLSSGMIFLFLFSLSYYLLLSKRTVLRYCAIFTSLAIACIDQWSALFSAFMYSLSALKSDKSERRVFWISCGVLLLSLTITLFISKTQFIIGPFHTPQLARDFISDFGGFSGMSFFIAALAIIGFILSWPRKITNALPYLSLPLLIPAYIYNPETILPLSVVFIFFATQATINLIKREWQLSLLQRFTLLLLFLGILFSALTFVDRVETFSPTKNDIEVLRWMDNKITAHTKIATFPEDAAYVRYFARKDTFFASYEQDPEKEEDNVKIFTVTYIQELFPVLEKNKIDHIYLSENAASRLPEDQGLRFLFQNERFKLLYSAEKSSVWKFGPPTEGTE